MAYSLSVNDAMNALSKISSRQNAVEKKIEKAKHDIQVEENAFLSRKTPLDKDVGYNYYITERDKAIRSSELAAKDIDDKIASLEAKKAAAIADFDRRIEALEQKRESEKLKHLERADMHQKNVDTTAAKYDGMKPTTATYTKLVANLAEYEKEKVSVEAEYREATTTLTVAMNKQRERTLYEMEVIERNKALEQKARDDAELRVIEARKEQIKAEEEARNRARVEESRSKARVEEPRSKAQIKKATPKIVCKHTPPETDAEPDDEADFRLARADEWDGWWNNTLYTRDMYLEDKKNCKQLKNGVPVWKLSKWYLDEED
jgi:hypothetical protein